MIVKSITKAYRAYNEDILIIQPPLYLVLDGATTLLDQQSSEKSSIASRLVAYIADHILVAYEREKDLTKALYHLSIDAYHHFNFKTSIPSELPSFSMAGVIDCHTHFKLYQMGDCAISIQKKNNRILPRFIDSSLSLLDKRVLDEMILGAKREETLSLLIKNRNLLGKNYQAFIPSLTPQFFMKTKKLMKKDLKKILIYSDGYYSVMTPFKCLKNHQVFLETPIEQVLSLIYQAAQSDPMLKRYPRFKLVDDISVIELTF